jgi:HrpA-like RNA helicase
MVVVATSAYGPVLSESNRKKIVDTVSLSRVTVIVGRTGSGKSTLVPPALLDGLKGPVLCSQPRRLAVVAISKRVAEQRGVVLGADDVGYHVGNHNLSTKKTQLLFTTAGILLEELRNNGVEALTKYACTIIDECHERSPESDLTLALIRDFMKKNRKAKIRLVLMSATFDHKRYIRYFTDVPGCDNIDVVNLESAESFEFTNQVIVYYLDRLPIPEKDWVAHRQWLEIMRTDPHSDLAYEGGRELSPGLLALTRSLVSYLDKDEPTESPFLIFSPTYAHLEQLYHTLSYLNNSSLELSVLHSAVDIEDCIRTMTSRRKIGRRHVFLASAIADSSITGE